MSREIESAAMREFAFLKARVDARFAKIEIPGPEALSSLNARIAAARSESSRQKGQ
jgi:hypothetical protein